MSELPCGSVSKRVLMQPRSQGLFPQAREKTLGKRLILMQNLSYENEFDDLHENEKVGGTHFHMNGSPRRPVLTQRQNEIRNFPILPPLSGSSEYIKPDNLPIPSTFKYHVEPHNCHP